MPPQPFTSEQFIKLVRSLEKDAIHKVHTLMNPKCNVPPPSVLQNSICVYFDVFRTCGDSNGSMGDAGKSMGSLTDKSSYCDI
jgi:hypothetical protein